jgi:monothiol glutaredoxin
MTESPRRMTLATAVRTAADLARVGGLPVPSLPRYLLTSRPSSPEDAARLAAVAATERGRQAMTDRFLDSRDAADDDAPKEIVITEDPSRATPQALFVNALLQGTHRMTAIDQIRETVATHDVVLYMKGTKEMPQCGFSSRVAGVLNYMGVEFKDINVLADAEIRQGIKDFSDWPTIPQLYVKGEFVGGCDIVTEMTLSGELDKLFDDKGVAYSKEAADKIRAANA